MNITAVVTLLSALAGLAACAGSDPIVDRMNVDDARYNRDLAACKSSSSSVPMVGTSVADCLKGKGYRVLMGR